MHFLLLSIQDYYRDGPAFLCFLQFPPPLKNFENLVKFVHTKCQNDPIYFERLDTPDRSKGHTPQSSERTNMGKHANIDTTQIQQKEAPAEAAPIGTQSCPSFLAKHDMTPVVVPPQKRAHQHVARRRPTWPLLSRPHRPASLKLLVARLYSLPSDKIARVVVASHPTQKRRVILTRPPFFLLNVERPNLGGPEI